MPRRSPFEICLSSSEQVELSRRAGKYTLPYFQVVRAKMILLAAQGLGNDEIAAQLGSRLYSSKKPAEPVEGRLFLPLALGAVLSAAFRATEILPGAESLLVGWMLAFLAGYWVPPRPMMRFIPWIVERSVLLLCFYLTAFKAPWLLKRAIPLSMAYGVPIAVFP